MPASTGKMALVAGGDRGLGRAVVEALVADGFDVVFIYRSHEDEARQVAETVADLGRDTEAIQLDTTRTCSFAALADALREMLHSRWARQL